MTSANQNEEKLQFSVDSSLLFQLGEQLVAKPSVALAELVKNAYDADATEIVITMENVGEPGGTISLADNGHGMTFEEIQNGWMRIATNSKQENPLSRHFSRFLTGAKGIGRFAARRLGSRLFLQSIAHRPQDNFKEAIGVTFEWNEFRPGTDITKVLVEYSRVRVADDSKTGVVLVVENARDAWTEDEIIALKRDLLSIQSPFLNLTDELQDKDNLNDPGFTIQLDIGGSGSLETLSGQLGEDFLSLNLAKLDGWIDESGTAHYSINIRESGEDDSLVDTAEEYKGLEPVKFTIYYFREKSSAFTGSPFRVRDFRAKAKQEAGVRVYLDGFRVFPYGEDGDDWLGLDYFAAQNRDMANVVPMSDTIRHLDESVREATRRAGGDPRPYLLIPRSQQLFGAVFLQQSHISNSNGNRIEIKASREGLIENVAFEQLVRFVQRGLYWLTLKYAAETIKPRAEARQNRQERKRSVTDIIEEARSEARSISPTAKGFLTEKKIVAETAAVVLPQVDKETAEQIVQQVGEELSKHLEPILETLDSRLEEASQQSIEEKEETISEFAMLRLLASAGTSLMIMQHQIQALVEQVDYVQNSLHELRPNIPTNIRERYDTLTQEVKSWHELVSTQVAQLGFILTPDNRQKRRRHALHEIVDNVRKSMAYYMEKNHVDFINAVPLDLRTPPIYQAELYAILLNILTNALKAVYGQSQRKIRVEADKMDDKLCLRMLNTGKRISDEMKKKAFDPFESDSIPNPILGTGTGLGLTVVRDTIEFYGGQAHFINVNEPWQTGIEFLIPYR